MGAKVAVSTSSMNLWLRSHLRESCPSQHNHDRVQDWVNLRIAFTSAAMYPVLVMFIVTTADRMLTTLPDVVQNQIFWMLRSRTYCTKNGEWPLKIQLLETCNHIMKAPFYYKQLTGLNLIFYE